MSVFVVVVDVAMEIVTDSIVVYSCYKFNYNRPMVMKSHRIAREKPFHLYPES